MEHKLLIPPDATQNVCCEKHLLFFGMIMSALMLRQLSRFSLVSFIQRVKRHVEFDREGNGEYEETNLAPEFTVSVAVEPRVCWV